MKTLKTILMVMAMMALMIPAAMADEEMSCDSDNDCPDGYGCVMMACACADCGPGEECPPCDCPEEGEGWCEYFGDDDWDDDWGFYGGECDVTADCPMGFTCELVNVPCMAEPTCPPCECWDCDPDDGEECPPCECPDCPEPEPCEPEEIGMCVYDMVDCESDSDCGEGFECLQVEECWGSGSSGGCACPPCVPDEECPPCECDDEPEYFEEECDVVGAFCAPIEQACEADADCMDGWECMMVSGGGISTGCACPECECLPCPPGEECEDCECPPCECDDEPIEEYEEEGYCVPDGWSEIIENGGIGGATYEDARDAMAGEIWGDENGATGGDDKDLQIAAPAAPNPDDVTEDPAWGCSAGQSAGAAPVVILLVAFIGLAVLPRRRTVTSR